MSLIAETDSLFFSRGELELSRLERQVANALQGADDGELFLEYRQSEALGWDDGRLRSASFDASQGFGLRSVAGEAAGYAHSNELTEEARRAAYEAVAAVHRGHSGNIDLAPAGTNARLYTDQNPISALSFDKKVKLLEEIDAYARARDPRVRQVSVSLGGSWQAVQIIRPDGERRADIRPMVRLNVSVVMEEGDRMESGSHGSGGRLGYDT